MTYDHERYGTYRYGHVRTSNYEVRQCKMTGTTATTKEILTTMMAHLHRLRPLLALRADVGVQDDRT